MLAYSVTQTQEQRLLMKVLDVSEAGDATIELTLETLAVTVMPADGARAIVVSSTQRPTNEEQNPSGVCHALVGLTLTVVVAPSGEVREIRGLETFQARVRRAFSEPAALSAMVADVLGVLSEERLRASIEPVFLLGTKATKPEGKPTAVPIVVKGLGSLTAQDSAASLVKDGVLTVHRTTDYTLVMPNADEIAKSFDVMLSDARAESESVVEPLKGVIRRSASTLRMTTTLTPKATGAGVGVGVTTRRVTQSLKVELVPEAETTPVAIPPAGPGTP